MHNLHQIFNKFKSILQHSDNLQVAANSGAARNFVREGPVTWRTSHCSFRLFSNSWYWYKAPAKNLSQLVSGGTWPLRPHSGCSTGSKSNACSYIKS